MVFIANLLYTNSVDTEVINSNPASSTLILIDNNGQIFGRSKICDSFHALPFPQAIKPYRNILSNSTEHDIKHLNIFFQE